MITATDLCLWSFHIFISSLYISDPTLCYYDYSWHYKYDNRKRNVDWNLIEFQSYLRIDFAVITKLIHECAVMTHRLRDDWAAIANRLESYCESISQWLQCNCKSTSQQLQSDCTTIVQRKKRIHDRAVNSHRLRDSSVNQSSAMRRTSKVWRCATISCGIKSAERLYISCLVTNARFSAKLLRAEY
jgi:hypothetical protein